MQKVRTWKKLFLILLLLETELNLIKMLLLYTQTLPVVNAPKIVLRSSNIRLIRPNALTTELFRAFLELEKHTFFIKGVLYTIGFQKITADVSDYAVFFLNIVKILKAASTDVANKAPTSFIHKQG